MPFEPDENYQRITLRIPRELHAKLTEAARARSHSMNAEIVQRLEGSFATERRVAEGKATLEMIEATKPGSPPVSFRIGFDDTGLIFTLDPAVTPMPPPKGKD